MSEHLQQRLARVRARAQAQLSARPSLGERGPGVLAGVAAKPRTGGNGWGRKAPLGGTGGEVVYAVGDVHGRLDLLEDLTGQIALDAGERAHMIVFLGDYVDRGPSSAEVLEWLLCAKRAGGDRVRLLKGNHEQALLGFLDAPARYGAWLDSFGGAATLRAYGVEVPDLGEPALMAARDALLDAMPAAHLTLLQGLETMVQHHDYAFVHAGVSPDAPLREQTEADLLWVREAFLQAKGPFEKIIVHGHTWQDDQPALLEHRIGVDTGAYETGVLTAVAIEDSTRRVLQALDPDARRRRADAERPAAAPQLVRRPADYALAPPDYVRTALTPLPLILGERRQSDDLAHR